MNDKNILYGGDFNYKFPFKSYGDFLVTSLEQGGDRNALVKIIF